MTDLVKPWRTLAEILSDPAARESPPVIVPRIAWGGRVTMLAAREKDGKSTLAAAAAGAVTRGRPFLGEVTATGPVLWVAVEEHPHDLAQRAEHFDTNPDRLVVLGITDEPLETLTAAVADVEPTLVVVDSLMTWAARYVGDDPHSSAKWTPIMSVLTALARDSSAAVMLLHHARKSDGAYRDSTAIGANVDVILEMSPSTEDSNLRNVKARGRWAMQGFSVRYTGTGFELSGGELSVETRTMLHIEHTPGISLKRLRDEVGGRAADVDRALTSLVHRGVVTDRGGAGGHAYYAAGTTPGTRGVVSDNSLWDKAGTSLGTRGLSQSPTLGGETGQPPQEGTATEREGLPF